ncbi:Vitamin B12 ABC transporter, substrate-binding protein BtuF [hydrothermal vent metagenome]|uniref:Vitamin B12 ABC transporter, substrate-binding protein BtuF n=1 Tax=hydrothermal vent metagenome TaxID=652676 RepID=A0A3B0T0Y0_9ZZZZ
MPRIRVLIATMVALSLSIAACSAATESAPPTTQVATTVTTTTVPVTTTTTPPETTTTVAEATDFPVTIESEGGTWTLDAAPQRIVSLSPTATEILFEIGAGDQIVAVDAYSYYPEEAPVTDLSGYDPNVEAVVAYEPDLVVIANDANDLVAALTALDIPVLVSPAPADIEGGFEAMAEIGLATGHVDETAATITRLRDEVSTALAAAPNVPIRIYHELSDSLYAASSFGFIGAVYAAMGTINVADEADPDGYGYPQLTEEYIVTADPELIIITDQVAYSADDVAARPGWDEITAVKNGNIVVVDADIASRWGPRLPQFIDAVAEALASVTVSTP